MSTTFNQKLKPANWRRVSLDWGLFLILAIAIKLNLTNGLDQGFTHLITAFQSGSRTTIFNWLTWSGSPIITLAGCLLLALVYILREQLLQAAIILLTIISGDGFAWIFKMLIQRPRPLVTETINQGFSFPSAHMVGAIILVSLLCHYWHPANHRYRVLQILIGFSWVALVGLSRIYLQAHFATDVLGGMLLGWTCWRTVTVLLPMMINRHLQRIDS